jgi:glycosyltransferase involved in cell wall biosynthesis
MDQVLVATGAAVPRFCVVVPVFNEAECIAEFHRRLVAAMQEQGGWHVVYVNDGSTDSSLQQLRDLRDHDPRIGIVSLSRNFGKELATTAGLDHAIGSAVIVIDADLQDPPEVIPLLISRWEEGYDVVYAQRRTRDGETLLKRVTARLFYRLMQDIGKVRLPPDTGDFRLMSWRVVEALGRIREYHRFMKGLFAWVGFSSVAVPYDRAPRFAGFSKWPYLKLLNLAVEGITSFTVLPLKFATLLGLAVSFLASIYLIQLLTRTLLFGNPVAGYPSLMAVVLVLGGVQLLTLGIIGEYLGRIFNETKQRPLYLVDAYLASDAGAGAKETLLSHDS